MPNWVKSLLQKQNRGGFADISGQTCVRITGAHVSAPPVNLDLMTQQMRRRLNIWVAEEVQGLHGKLECGSTWHV